LIRRRTFYAAKKKIQAIGDKIGDVTRRQTTYRTAAEQVTKHWRRLLS